MIFRMHISFSCIQEDRPGEKWKALFNRTWPHYKAWFLSEGAGARKGYLTSYTELKRYMPELVPYFDQLVAMAGGGDLEGRFLTMYCPPAYMSGCSQAAWTNGSNSLIRNYDYSFKMFEGTMMYTQWRQPVIGVTDCTWGLLDGMNAFGLAASLTFGGRKIVGDGFGIPIIIRYVLEMAKTVEEGIAILNRIPVHMAYNVTLVDDTGNYSTVYLSPDRKPVIVNTPVATNHQMEIEWGDYASLTGTIERKKYLDDMISSPFETEATLLNRFLHPPLYNTNFEKSFGTLYTIIYRINAKNIEVLWPNKHIYQAFDEFTEYLITPLETDIFMP